MGADRWARRTNRETFALWKGLRPGWVPGFKVFYSPVSSRPPIMVLTLNPGSSVKNFRRDKKDGLYRRLRRGDFSPPRASYAEHGSRMARGIRCLMGCRPRLVDRAVVMPVLFFRSEDYRGWRRGSRKKYGPQKRRELEAFCLCKVCEALEVVRPRAILVVGNRTLRLLEGGDLGPLAGKRAGSTLAGGQKLWQAGSWKIRRAGRQGRVPVFCSIHLTGARVSGRDAEALGRRFGRFLRKNGIR